MLGIQLGFPPSFHVLSPIDAVWNALPMTLFPWKFLPTPSRLPSGSPPRHRPPCCLLPPHAGTLGALRPEPEALSRIYNHFMTCVRRNILKYYLCFSFAHFLVWDPPALSQRHSHHLQELVLITRRPGERKRLRLAVQLPKYASPWTPTRAVLEA